MLTDPTRRDVLRAAAGGLATSGEIATVALITVSPNRTLICGELRTRCALGRTGVRRDKREGDGATPSGRYPLREVLFRRDRLAGVVSRLPLTPIGRHDGWCTDPADPDYNRKITLPRAGPHEDLWRNDALYDIVVVIGYNDAPVVPGKGSAIFLHVARPAMTPTDGCVAIPTIVLLDVIKRCDVTTSIEIQI